MGVTALGLLVIGLVNCVIMTQKKSKIPFLPSFLPPSSFLHWLGKLFWGISRESSPGHSLWVGRSCVLQSLFCRSLGPGVEGASTCSSTERPDAVRAVQGGDQDSSLGLPGLQAF